MIFMIILSGISIYQYNWIMIESKYKITSAVKNALEEDLGIRLSSPKVNLRKGFLRKELKDSLEEKKIVVRSAAGEKTYSYKKGMDRHIVNLAPYLVYQSAIRTINPIQVNHLDSIFHSLLLRDRIQGETGILYIDTIANTRLHSNEDMSIYTSSIHTDVIPLGIIDEMEVQAFVRYYPHWIFQPIGRRFLCVLILLIVGGIVIVIYGFYYWKTERAKKRVQEEEKKKEPVEEIPLGKYTLDVTHGWLILDGKKEYIRKRQEFAVLVQLLKAPNRMCTREELFKLLDKKEGMSAQLSAIISRLRRLVKEDPSIRITYDNKTGDYQLTITENPEK